MRYIGGCSGCNGDFAKFDFLHIVIKIKKNVKV